MKLLLDTHIWLWALLEPERLGPGVRAALESADNELWLYFEVELPSGVDGSRVHFLVLQSLHADQLNSLRVRDGSRSLTLTFPPAQGERTVRFPPS